METRSGGAELERALGAALTEAERPSATADMLARADVLLTAAAPRSPDERTGGVRHGARRPIVVIKRSLVAA